MKCSYSLPGDLNNAIQVIALASPDIKIKTRLNGERTPLDILFDYFLKDERFFSNTFTEHLEKNVETCIKRQESDTSDRLKFFPYSNVESGVFSWAQIYNLNQSVMRDEGKIIPDRQTFFALENGNLSIISYANHPYNIVLNKEVKIYKFDPHILQSNDCAKYIPLVRIDDKLMPTTLYRYHVNTAHIRTNIPSKSIIKFYIKNLPNKKFVLVTQIEIVPNEIENIEDPYKNNFQPTIVLRKESKFDISKLNINNEETC